MTSRDGENFHGACRPWTKEAMNWNCTAPIFDRTQRPAKPAITPQPQPAALSKPKPEPKPPAPSPILQDRFLVRMLEAKRAVDLHLQNGESFSGAIIIELDKYALTAMLGERQVCILKHALAWLEVAVKAPSGQ